MHLPKSVARRILTDLSKIVRPGGLFAATLTYGVKSRIVTDGWVPGRYFARWKRTNSLVWFVKLEEHS
jgi:hypothetical protein